MATRPAAQQLGTRFKVRGYPTTIVLRPDGSEITRLPGEVDPQRYLDVLGAALKATHPVQALRDDALAKRRALSADEWRLLAYYSWETDEQQLAGKGETAELVTRLAAVSPAGALHDRLVLKAMSLRAEDAAKTHARPDAVTRATLQRVLADPEQTYANFDLLVYGADQAVQWLGTDQTPGANRRFACGLGTRRSPASPNNRACHGPTVWPRSMRASASRNTVTTKRRCRRNWWPPCAPPSCGPTVKRIRRPNARL